MEKAAKTKILICICFVLFLIHWHLSKVCADSQLGQRGSDGVAGVRHGSIRAGGVRQGVGQ